MFPRPTKNLDSTWTECPLLRAEQTSISGCFMSACSQQATFWTRLGISQNDLERSFRWLDARLAIACKYVRELTLDAEAILLGPKISQALLALISAQSLGVSRPPMKSYRGTPVSRPEKPVDNVDDTVVGHLAVRNNRPSADNQGFAKTIHTK